MRLYPQANQVDEPAVPTEAVAPPLPQHPAHEHHNCCNLNTFSVRLAGILLEAVTPGSRPRAIRTTSLRNSRGHGLPTTPPTPTSRR